MRRAVNYLFSSNPSEDDRLAYNLTLALLYFALALWTLPAPTWREPVSEAAAGENSGYLSVECANLLEAYDNNLKGARAVDNLTADGGTHIANGLVSAMNALQNQSGNRVIILLSDGEDSEESANQMDSVINQLTQQGIVVYAVGFDFADSAYLSRICEATGGKFLRSESSEDLGSVYQTIEKFLSRIM